MLCEGLEGRLALTTLGNPVRDTQDGNARSPARSRDLLTTFAAFCAPQGNFLVI